MHPYEAIEIFTSACDTLGVTYGDNNATGYNWEAVIELPGDESLHLYWSDDVLAGEWFAPVGFNDAVILDATEDFTSFDELRNLAHRLAVRFT